MKIRKGEVQNDLDTVKLAEIYILRCVLLGGRLTKVIYANLIMILEDAYLCREYGWGELSFDENISSLKSLLKPTKTTVGSSYQLVGFPYAFMKGAVEAFSLEHEMASNNDSEDKRFSLLNQKLDKLQSTYSKKFKKILDENKSLKFELSEIKTLLLGKLKADGDILSDKQPDNLQGYTNRVALNSDAFLSLPFHVHDKLFFDIHATSFEVIILEIPYFPSLLSPESLEDFPEKKRNNELKKRRMQKVIQMRNKKPQKEESLNAGAEDLLPFPLVEEFSKCSLYSELQNFGGIEVDEDNIDETKNCGDVDPIINNVISSVSAASSSLSTSPDVKNTQAERSDLSGIKNDTTDMIFDVDATMKFVNIDSTTCVVEISHDEQESTRVSPMKSKVSPLKPKVSLMKKRTYIRKKKGNKVTIIDVASELNSMPSFMEAEVKYATHKKSVKQKFLG
ncbi:hypothetical protein CQW23_21441 [Capsicum baccatum]|uniref:DUF1985 domain-containing protein n=1 Tax=Capsicum baccatum TaxID=33114 RepID=A0A2G2VY17_CAPBA|nr:hypothetical protein CQW23_21441 [Capsicum baccatum]